jgi:hypothetical protein
MSFLEWMCFVLFLTQNCLDFWDHHNIYPISQWLYLKLKWFWFTIFLAFVISFASGILMIKSSDFKDTIFYYLVSNFLFPIFSIFLILFILTILSYLIVYSNKQKRA